VAGGYDDAGIHRHPRWRLSRGRDGFTWVHRFVEHLGLGEDRERVSAGQVSVERLEVTGEVVAEICETVRAPT